jgi:4-hydroxymandelate oxidase
VSDRSGSESVARYVNLLELEGMACRVLPRHVFDFYAGGAADEITLRAARDAFLGWRLLPHVLAGVGEIDLSTELLGDRLEWPVFIAPTGAHRLAHDAGELASASAARAENTLLVASLYSTVSLEEIAAVAGQRWFNCYLLRDRGLARALVERAEIAGYRAVVMTVDQPVAGRRERDIRNAFQLPAGIKPANFVDLERTAVSPMEQMTAMQDPTLTSTDLACFIDQSPLPVIAKGILRSEDALRAAEAGAAAVYVSNHGPPTRLGRPCARRAARHCRRCRRTSPGADRRRHPARDRRRQGARARRARGRDRTPRPLRPRPRRSSWRAGRPQLLREELILALALCGRTSPRELDRDILVSIDDSRLQLQGGN